LDDLFSTHEAIIRRNCTPKVCSTFIENTAHVTCKQKKKRRYENKSQLLNNRTQHTTLKLTDNYTTHG